MKKNNKGRPRIEYKDTINNEVLEYIKKCKQSNISDAEIFKKIGISQTKGIEWKKQYPQFLKAFKKGQEELLIDMENMLYKRAMGYDVDDRELIVKKNKNNEVIETIVKNKKKHIWSDSNLQMILKKLNPEKWGDNDKFKLSPEKIKEIIDKMTPEELEVFLNG